MFTRQQQQPAYQNSSFNIALHVFSKIHDYRITMFEDASDLHMWLNWEDARRTREHLSKRLIFRYKLSSSVKLYALAAARASV